MIDNFLNGLKVKKFISVSKDTQNFDIIRKLEVEGLIEKKNKYTYQLTKDGYRAADMGYDKFHSLERSTKNTSAAPTKYPNKKAHIMSIIVKWWWMFIIPIIIIIIGLYIQNLYFLK